jgi:predicted ABC-type ATPase
MCHNFEARARASSRELGITKNQAARAATENLNAHIATFVYIRKIMTKRIIMISGPNGAGKTTTAMSFISNEMIEEFINADEIARGLAPIHPESMSLTASKLMLKRLKELLEANKSFAFETTGSGTNYIKHLKEAQTNGYEVHLMFLWLPSPDLAIKRVAQRVEQGGHHIPADTIRRRYYAGLKNLIIHYLPLANRALILDNSIAGSNNIIVRKHVDSGLKIEEPHIWKAIQEVAYAK